MRFIITLCLAGFASSFALRAVEPILPVIAADLRITLWDAALLVTAYSIPYALMQLVLGPVGDAVGKSRLIRLSMIVFTGGLAFSALAPGYMSLLAGRAVSGAFAGGIVPVAMALIGDRIPFDRRQVAISRFLIATISGQMVGAAVAGAVVGLAGWRVVFGAFALVAALCSVPVLIFLRGQDESRRTPTLRGAISGYRAVFNNPNSRVVFATVAGEGMLVLGVLPFLVPLLVVHGADGPLEGGMAVAAFAVGGIIYGFLARRLLTVLSSRGMMRLGVGIVAAVYVATLAPVGWPMEVLLFGIAGFGFFTLHNTMQTQGTELAPTARGSAMALFASFLFLGQGVGPVVAGWATHTAGVELLFVGTGLLIAGLGFVAASAIKRR
jgi:MFS transporter, DHA1 family, inner membrane transport protein